MEHKHNWKPLINWNGRYRCVICGCFGYRGIVTASYSPDGRHFMPNNPELIIPYKCSKKGCNKAAIKKVRRRWKCADHGAKKMKIYLSSSWK